MFPPFTVPPGSGFVGCSWRPVADVEQDGENHPEPIEAYEADTGGVDDNVDQGRKREEDDTKSGRRKVLNAAPTRAGLAIHTMSSASRGKRPPNNANKQPILFASCLVLLRQLQRGCLVRVADQAALAAGGVAIHRSVLSVRFSVCSRPA